jgi:hypothetical protein
MLDHDFPMQEDSIFNASREASRPARSGGGVNVAVVLGFMEDQWSRTSLLAKQKEQRLQRNGP